MWTDQEIKKTWMSAKRYALSWGYINDCDDFAQEATLKLMAGRRAKMQHIFIDWLRTEKGRGTSQRDLIQHRAFEKIARHCCASQNDLEKTLIDKKMVELFLSCFHDRTALILKLYYMDDLSLLEIGNKFNITESRVSQVISHATILLRHRLKLYGISYA